MFDKVLTLLKVRNGMASWEKPRTWVSGDMDSNGEASGLLTTLGKLYGASNSGSFIFLT